MAIDMDLYMVYFMTMIMVNIFEAKAKLSEFIDAMVKGERVLICKRNVPVAELRPVAAARTAPRPVGLAAGKFAIPDAFFAALPDKVLAAFEIDDTAPALAQVAERPHAGGYTATATPEAPVPTRAVRRRPTHKGAR